MSTKETTPPKGSSIYYAHHRWKYGTQIEAYELSLIREYFPTSTIFNPSEHLDVEGRSEEDIMKDCLAAVRDADIVIFSSVNGVVGKGVYEELQEAARQDKMVLYMFWDHLVEGKFDVLRLPNGSMDDRTYAIVNFYMDVAEIVRMLMRGEAR